MGASLFVIDDEVWHARGVIFIDGDGRVGVVLRNIQIDPLQIVLGHFSVSRQGRVDRGRNLAVVLLEQMCKVMVWLRLRYLHALGAGAPRGGRDQPALGRANPGPRVGESRRPGAGTAFQVLVVGRFDCDSMAGLNRGRRGRIFETCPSSDQLSGRGKIPDLAGR